jgi:hypothetical protein
MIGERERFLKRSTCPFTNFFGRADAYVMSMDLLPIAHSN